MSDDLKSIGMHGGASPQIFRRADSLRLKMTEPEKKLWDFLKQKPLGFKFRRQHPFDMYVLDFFCLKAKLSIEVDGKSHSNKVQILQDNFKREVLYAYNIKEIRFSNSEVLDDFEKVKAHIIEFLKRT